MSIVKRIIQDSIERVKVDELLADEYEQAGYGGIQLTKTPMGAQINLFAMRPGRVIGKRGRAIKEASERLERELGLSNPQITVVEVEVPELNPRIMASRVANALERGIHFRRAIFWSLSRIMESGAIGCEVILKGPLRSARSRFEKVVEGYVPKSGDPALKYVKTATIHVKMKRGTLGVTVNIVPPDAVFPDKINLDNLPEIEYQQPAQPEPAPEVSQEEITQEPEQVEPTESIEEKPTETTEPTAKSEPEPVKDSDQQEPHEEPEKVKDPVEETEQPVKPEKTVEVTEEALAESVIEQDSEKKEE
jgi:small subunit ribosomal protein S3